ncbi:hypothetical protein BH721_10695 [Clostridium baratii]|uniref:Abortive infection protein-like C-terminal domain-containing protein n=1 Tax=Clostridium baratii TaxID=1561 RepID=A0A174PWN2_9CLOT|nr:hypothetical protein [Clostridium baratii]OPF51930.1 hypothetical protein A1M12_05205 [Clostridium baratii]OPF53575.1 hypothetical protein BH721_10695 [Clostridium baratii]OPF56492.1 hypothetical protein BH724_11840 [Clostridium baratii]OPF60622.1 hypothetical protein BH725_08660 [Clostridium baratii]CUP63170.1 Uncharacterised protein [Clostridium baratii]
MIFELFSKRMKKQREHISDIYIYDDIPTKLRIQIIHIWNDAIGNDHEAWEFINKTMLKELGKLQLVREYFNYDHEYCKEFLLKHDNVEEVIDIVELSFLVIDKIIRKRDPFGQRNDRCQKADDAITDLNYRFKENSVGYEYIEGKIIRVDRMFTHNEIVKPSIKLLYEEEFEGACNEFLKAHEHYKNKEYKDSILYSGKAFESTMKTICEKLKYPYDKEKHTANKLIGILCDKDFIPISLKTHFDGLDKAIGGIRTSLDSGLPTLRNRKGGHGQGDEVVYVPEELVTYALNLSATNIVLLVNLYKKYK